MRTADRPALELRGITKRFGDLVANDAIDLDVGRGEVHALLGENGAGKTTVMRIAYGLTQADAGDVLVDGEPVTIRSPRDAIRRGIGMVTQHFSLVGPLSVAENLALGRSAGLRLGPEQTRRRAAAEAERFGMRIDPAARVDSLSIGQQQRLEILKALSRECRILILDEPTAVLVPSEVGALFATLRTLVANGLAVVFVSHKLAEVRAISDRVSVLRRGRLVDTVPGSTDERELAKLMVGRPAFGLARDRDATPAPGPTLLAVESLNVQSGDERPTLSDVSLEVHAGEIVGVAGVSGNGQTELVEVLSGMRRPSSGSVRVDGAEIAGANPERMMRAGVGRIPEDRHASLIGELSVAYNLVLERLESFTRGRRIDEAAIRSHAAELMERFDIRAAADDPVVSLSGGNLQKVLLARVLAREPRVIVVSQPTRGLDVGATEYVRRQLIDRSANGAAILLVSEDLDELLALADRLVVMYEGRVIGQMEVAGADLERLSLLMAGRVAA